MKKTSVLALATVFLLASVCFAGERNMIRNFDKNGLKDLNNQLKKQEKLIKKLQKQLGQSGASTTTVQSTEDFVSETVLDSAGTVINTVPAVGVAREDGRLELYDTSIDEATVISIEPSSYVHETQAKIAVPSGYYLNLIGAYLTAATRKYSASAIVLADANSNTVTILNMDITNNVGTAGPVANGRDVAAAFLYPGWVYFYAIYNPVTGDIASLSSKEKTTPTLPSGYTFYRRLGSAYLNGSGNLITTTQYGNRYSDTTFVLEDGDPDDADTWQALDIRTAVPPTAKSVFGYFGVTANTVAEYGMAISSVNSMAGGIGVTIPIITVNASTDYQPVGGTFFELNLPEEYTLYWKASATGARYGVKIIGFIDDL